MNCTSVAARDQPGQLISFTGSKFKSKIPDAMRPYSLSEETKGALFDPDNDGDLDLYMSTGGRFFPGTSSVLKDEILINDGRGNFSEPKTSMLPVSYASTSVALPIDYDNDGDQDLLIGERFDPFVYGLGGRGYVYQNDGGKFTDVTDKVGPVLSNIGMVTDGVVADVDGDGWQDVVLVGDWMPIVFLEEQQRSLRRYLVDDGTIEHGRVVA